ncbi:MAG: hypothetical protein KDI46_01160 [Alphaproteobacteria bacterium]|nr:hypothetical protein [Alphaproteobacteria bacterium]
MRGGFLIFLLLIPASVALGHDVYLFYQNYLLTEPFSIDLVREQFKFSALGFIWTTYEVNSYKQAVETLDPQTWAWIDYFLTFKAFFVGLGFAGFFIVLFGVLALFGVGPFASEGGIVYGSDKKTGGHVKGQTMKYNRK